MPWSKPYSPPRNQRLSPELYTHKSHVYFITIRAYKNQSPFVLPPLNRTIVNILMEEQERQHCTVFTYCLMPDHLHFLIRPNMDGISVLDFTDRFKGKTTNRSWAVGWRGKLWQSRYYDHIVRGEEDLYKIAQYILDNPIRKDLVAPGEAWPWSGHMNPLP